MLISHISLVNVFLFHVHPSLNSSHLVISHPKLILVADFQILRVKLFFLISIIQQMLLQTHVQMESLM